MIGDVFIRAGSDYGAWRYGCVGALVHSLEAPAKPGMARGLVDWLKSEGLSPHTMSDPTPLSVQVLDEQHAGAHAGSVANLYLAGFEQTGYAAWSLAQWTDPVAFEAVKAVARSIARLWRVMGWDPRDVEWGSVGQLQQAVANAKAGRPFRPMLWTHFDVTQAFPGTTNHTDPGKGYPYAILRQLVRQYLGTWDGTQIGTPNTPPADGPGGAQKGFLMALSDAEQSELLNKVRLLFDDNKLDGYPYGKQAAGFNDVREMAKVTDSIEDKIDWLLANERIPLDDKDPDKGAYPFTKSAATFDDVRRVEGKIDALIAALAPKA